MNPLVTAEIHAQAIEDNIRALRRRLRPGTALCPAVKADAYGHGVAQVLPALAAAGVEGLGVAHLTEALALRQAGYHSGPIEAASHKSLRLNDLPTELPGNVPASPLPN